MACEKNDQKLDRMICKNCHSVRCRIGKDVAGYTQKRLTQDFTKEQLGISWSDLPEKTQVSMLANAKSMS
jgi:hypothetical protein